MQVSRLFLMVTTFLMLASSPLAAEPTEPSETVLESMTQSQLHRRMNELARSFAGLERKFDRLDDRVGTLNREVKELKRKV